MITTFYSYRGGVARTMALANVGVALAQRNEGRVLLVDFDLESPGLHCTPGLEPPAPITGGLLPWIADGCSNYAAWRDAVYTPRADLPLDVLPACVSMLDGSRALQRIRFDSLTEFVDDAKNNPLMIALLHVLDVMGGYTHILIDAPAGVGDLSAIALFQLPKNAILIGDYSPATKAGLALADAALRKHSIPYRAAFELPWGCGQPIDGTWTLETRPSDPLVQLAMLDDSMSRDRTRHGYLQLARWLADERRTRA